MQPFDTRKPNPEAGIALALTIVLVVVIGVLITGAISVGGYNVLANQNYERTSLLHSAAMSGLLGSGEITPSDQIEIDTNEIAENGSVVPIEVRSAIPDTQAISLFASKNPFPALAEFTLTPDVDPVISCRIKLAETGEVIVVVAAGGKLYSAKRPVKVTAGGCGG